MPGAANIEEEAAVLVVPGVWMRSLRYAERLRLTDVARPGVSAPTLHRRESGRALIRPFWAGSPPLWEWRGGAPR